MEFSPSKEAASHSATECSPIILWNSNVHRHVKKNNPLVPIMRHINPIHITQSYLCKIHFNINLPHASKASYSFLSLWVSHCIHHHSPMRVTCPAHLILLAIMKTIVEIHSAVRAHAVCAFCSRMHECTLVPNIRPTL